MDLAAPVEEVKGIGPKTAEVLRKANILTLRDLVYHLPRDYENYQQAQSISSLKPGNVVIKAKVETISTRRMRRNLALTEATLRDQTGAIKAIWFNQPYRAKQFDSEKEYSTTVERLTGKTFFSKNYSLPDMSVLLSGFGNPQDRLNIIIIKW